MMKLTVPMWLALALALSTPASATVPGEVDFQGLLLDAGGAPVNGAVPLFFEIFDAPSNGTSLWSESHASVDVVDGVYDVTLGSTTPLSPAIFAGGAVYLEITVDGETLAPRERLVAVPYALRAAEAESAASVGGISDVFVSDLFEHFAFDGADPPNTDPREGTADTDGDGTPNFVDPDNDGDGLADADELAGGSDINLVTPVIASFTPPTADGFANTLVTVHGQNFDPGITVSFGSESPTPANVTPTSFEVTVGSQPEGNATVEVTNPNAEIATASYPFFLLTPTIQSFSPISAIASTTTSVTVSGTNFAPGITVSFGAENPIPTNVTAIGFDVQVGPQAVGSVPVVVTHPNGKVSAAASFDFVGERIVFVTSTLQSGNLGGVAGANGICNQRAALAGLPGSYKAWLSDATSSPSTTFLQSAIPYERPDGVVVADDWADLVDGTLDAPIDPTGGGTTAVWTATLADGTADPGAQHCASWGSTSGVGMVGLSTSVGPDTWTNNGTRACNLSSRLYCFQQ